MGRLRTGVAWLGTQVSERAGVWHTHYVTVTCDLACETFDRPSDLIYLATDNGQVVKKGALRSTMVPHLKTTTPVAKSKSSRRAR